MDALHQKIINQNIDQDEISGQKNIYSGTRKHGEMGCLAMKAKYR